MNKVDQRRHGDRDTDGVRRFVQRDLDLVDEGADQRIFETKGQHALAAARVLSHYPRSGDSSRLKATPEVQALLGELFSEPEDRQEAMENWTEGRLLARAERVWQASGLPTLLGHAIGRLRASAVPMVLTSALDKVDPLLVSLRDVAKLRLQAARVDRQRVESELESLEQENRLLSRVRSEAPDARKFGLQVEGRLHAKLESIRVVGRRVIDGLDREVSDALPTFPETKRHSRAQADEGLLKRLTGLVNPINLLGQARETAFPSENGHRERSDGVFEFDTAEDANDFIQGVTSVVLGQLRRAVDVTREDLNRTVMEVAAEVVREQDRKVRPIVERASQRLSEAFDLTLSVPPLQLTSGDIEVEPLLPLLEESTHVRTRTRTERKRRWYTLWLVKVPITVTETYDEVTRVHLVDLEALKSQLSEGFNGRLAAVSDDVKHYMVDHLISELERYFTGVDAYLRRYTKSLEQAQVDASQTEADKADTARELDRVVAEAEDHLDAVVSLKSRLV